MIVKNFKGFTRLRRSKKRSQLTTITNRRTMKKINKILMAALATAAFTAVNRAQADEPYLSPRAQDNQIHHIAGTPSANDFDLVREIRDKGGTPHSKGDWSRETSWAILYSPRNNRDLVLEMRDLNGTPRMKAQQASQPMSIAPLK